MKEKNTFGPAWSYDQARAWLDQVGAKGNLLGLTSIRILLKELGNPQDQLRFAHIAGTNGKGSVMTFLEYALREAGYRTGRYISPVLFCYEEKIQVAGQYIARETVARLTQQIAGAVENIAERGDPTPTIFEVETAMSFLYFLEQHCDVVLLETGMGGREDATNIVTTTVLELICSISMDHMQYLGDTLAEIAWNKAGIIKPGTQVVSDAQEEDVLHVLQKVSKEQGASLHMVDPDAFFGITYGLSRQTFSYKGHTDVKIHLAGNHQIRNAALALEAVDALRDLGWDLPEEAVLRGFAKAVWEGRFQVLSEHPVVVMDGAHNPDAAQKLMESVKTLFSGRRLIYIFGVFSDKEYDKIIQITAPAADVIFATQTRDNARALPARELKEAVSRVNPNVRLAGDVPQSIQAALLEAGEEDVILIFGSLSFLWEAREFFEHRNAY